MRFTLASLGAVVLAATWLGPLPAIARQSFAAHMSMHMAVVAIGAPLVAVAMSGTALDPARILPRLFAPIPASLFELVVVWAWHAPAWHHAARQQAWALAIEQGSFVAAGLLLWVAACGGDREQGGARGAAGVVALLFTSMHMTLLGALFALANRPLFSHAADTAGAAAALADQQLGGAIMLLVGGTSYLTGGLWLTGTVLRSSRHAVRPSRMVHGETAS
jgi:putative membrane protein